MSRTNFPNLKLSALCASLFLCLLTPSTLRDCQGSIDVSNFIERLSVVSSRAKTVAVFHSPIKMWSSLSILDNETSILSAVIRNLRTPIMTFTTAASLVPLLEIKKNYDVDLVIISTDSFPGELLRHTNTIKNYRFVGQQTKMLILADDVKLTFHDVNETFHLVWEKLKVFQTVLAATSDNRVKMYTRNPYDSVSLPYAISNDGGSKEKDIFCNVLPKNFNGYPLKVGFSIRPPYILPPDEHGLFVQGPDVFLVRTIAQALNLTVVQVTSPDSRPELAIVNGQLNGYFKMLFNQELDLYCGGTAAFSDRFSLSSPLPAHEVDETTWALPRQYPELGWTYLYKGFTKTVWLFIVGTIASITIILCVVQYLLASSDLLTFIELFFVTCGITLEAAVAIDLIFRPILFMTLPSFSVLSSSYKATLFKLLTAPSAVHQIASLREAFDRKLFFHMAPLAITRVDQSSEFWREIVNLGNHIIVTDSHAAGLINVSINRSSIAYSLKNFIDFNTIEHGLFDYNGDSLTVKLQEESYGFQIQDFMSPGHPLHALFDYRVTALIEMGLARHALDSLIFFAKVESLGKLNSSRGSMDDSASALTLDELSPVLFILLILYALSSLVFFGELIWYNCSNSRLIMCIFDKKHLLRRGKRKVFESRIKRFNY